ncbi:hypothetical protein LX95_02862 [Mesonia algae]|uniref:Uncharacterized protein n=1 Tax=Mesonia algae TaxID=213248 RepID=A0A2W7HWA0_9FLAO|nr:hypothetical protein [Mesonia algae]PZW37635.1 hypothetical protein LX95_02862 [Mesonia algae]
MSCSKDEDFSETQQLNNLSENNLNLSVDNNGLTDSTGSSNYTSREIIIGYHFTWDEWGRKKYDCRRGGLCNFRLEAITIEVGFRSAPIQGDENGNLYVEILIDNTMPKEYDYEYFPIDEDISFSFDDEETYTINSGLYEKIDSIGKSGGYRLPLIKS